MIVVEKYGGSSVATIDKIKLIAKHLKEQAKEKKKIVVVVSAMGKTTNNLISLAKEIQSFPNKRELDALLVTGEQQTISLLSMALKEIKVKAVSLCGFQAGVKTTNNFGKAFLKDIEVSILKKYLKKFDVVVVAGFQGICNSNEFTTLGRGGSDTTAVAIASKLKCECNIFTDVEGVFYANPNTHKNVKKHKEIFVDTMLEMANCGAKVLDTRCLEIAKKYKTELFLGKSLEEDKTKGTKIIMKKNFETPKIDAVCEKDEMCFFEIENKQNTLSKILKYFENNNQNLEMFSHSQNKTFFAVAKNDAQKTYILLKKALKNQNIKFCESFCQISLVGFGFSTHPEILSSILKHFEKNKIFVKKIVVSETVLSLLINQDKKTKAFEIIFKLFKGLKK